MMSVVNAISANNQASPGLMQDKTEQLQKTVQDTVQNEDVSLAEKLELANKEKEIEKKETEEMSPKQLEKVAQQLQDFMGEMNRSLEFLVDKDSGRDVIKVLDRGTGDLVKQYPSEELLTLISKLSDATGNLIDTEI